MKKAENLSTRHHHIRVLGGLPMLIIGIVIVAVLAVLGLTDGSGNTQRILIKMCLYCTMACMWNLLSGFTGMTSLGQQSFIGVAGYSMAIMTATYGMSYVVGWIVGGAIGAVLALILSLILFRMRGMYFAIATWVIAEALKTWFNSWEFVNMGGGTCEVAVMSLGGIVINQSLRVAGEAIDEAIVSLLRQNYTLAIGESTAEEIKIAIGSVIPLEQELRMDVKGRDLVDGLPKVVTISSEEVRDAIEPIIVQIEDTIRTTLERTPPELVRDIVDQGIVLSGGTANLRGLNIRFADALNVPIHIAEQPLYSVALGLGKILETPRKPSEVSITLDNKPGA